MPSMPELGDWTYTVPDFDDVVLVDVVRFQLQDTDPDIRLLSDLELQYLVDFWMPKYDSAVYVSAQAALVIAAKFAGVVSVNADGVSVAVGDISGKYAALAESLFQVHKDAAVGAEIDITNLGWDAGFDWTIAPLVFSEGMHDNIYAGQQNFGGYPNRSPYPEGQGWL